MQKRLKPRALVSASLDKKRKSWMDLLSSNDRSYIVEVISEMRLSSNVQPYVIARLLKKELNLPVSLLTISRTLKDMT
jgi:hypothetical protein